MGVNRRSIAVLTTGERKKEKWSNIIDCTWSLLSDYPGRQRDEGQCTTRRKVVLEMSHYSIQEVEQRAGTHGYRATGPILPDGLRVRGEAARGGSSGGTGGGSWICWMQNESEADPEAALRLPRNDKEEPRHQWLESHRQVQTGCCDLLLNVASNVLHQMVKHIRILSSWGLFQSLYHGLKPCSINDKIPCLIHWFQPPSCHLSVLLLPPRPRY